MGPLAGANGSFYVDVFLMALKGTRPSCQASITAIVSSGPRYHRIPKSMMIDNKTIRGCSQLVLEVGFTTGHLSEWAEVAQWQIFGPLTAQPLVAPGVLTFSETWRIYFFVSSTAWFGVCKFEPLVLERKWKIPPPPAVFTSKPPIQATRKGEKVSVSGAEVLYRAAKGAQYQFGGSHLFDLEFLFGFSPWHDWQPDKHVLFPWQKRAMERRATAPGPFTFASWGRC